MQILSGSRFNSSLTDYSLLKIPTGNLARTVFAFLIGTMLTYTNAEANNGGNGNSEESEEIKKQLEGRTLIPLIDTDARNGSNNQACTIIVTETGVLGSGFENLEMGSKVYGGRAGVAQVMTTNGSYSLSLDPPLGFSAAPAGGNSNVNMITSFQGSGVTNFSETPGNLSIRLKNGTTTVQTHLTAKRTNNLPFPAGYYSTAVTLRCE